MLPIKVIPDSLPQEQVSMHTVEIEIRLLCPIINRDIVCYFFNIFDFVIENGPKSFLVFLQVVS